MKALRYLSLLAVILLATAATVSLLTEAYGSGPPYYGRTTNMDKWASPWPAVAVIDILALLIATGLAWPRR